MRGWLIASPSRPEWGRQLRRLSGSCTACKGQLTNVARVLATVRAVTPFARSEATSDIPAAKGRYFNFDHSQVGHCRVTAFSRAKNLRGDEKPGTTGEGER
jgi:hypothetical protein